MHGCFSPNSNPSEGPSRGRPLSTGAQTKGEVDNVFCQSLAKGVETAGGKVCVGHRPSII